MKLWTRLASLLVIFSATASAQQIARITDPSAINPAEVSIAINPKNPDNMIAASFQTGQPPRPRAGSYHYVTVDGGKTWKTVPTPNMKNLTQGDDVVRSAMTASRTTFTCRSRAFAWCGLYARRME